MEPILVTGGTGRLGREVVRSLQGGETEIRVLSRRPGTADRQEPHRRVIGDLRTGHGLDAPLAGVGTVVHCATTNGRGDVAATRNLVEAARRNADAPHLVYVSIVGIDTLPVPYYRAKLASERLIADSGLSWTVQRTTQFHGLLADVFAWQHRMPMLLALARIGFQPIDTRDVADRLTGLVTGTPQGRAPDIGGPHVSSMSDLARSYDNAYGRHRRVVPVRLPGRTARRFAEGDNLVPRNRFGTISFEDYLAERAGSRG